jgi:hypothetical protein
MTSRWLNESALSAPKRRDKRGGPGERAVRRTHVRDATWYPSRNWFASSSSQVKSLFRAAILPHGMNEFDEKSHRGHDVACLTLVRAGDLVRGGAAKFWSAGAVLSFFRFAAAAATDFFEFTTA